MQSGRHGGSEAGLAARRKPLSARRVGTFVPALVREACRRRGFNNIDIVLRWREIVGPELAEQTWPLRIEWPRRQEAVLRPDGTAEPRGQRTRLVIGTAPARALDVEYAKSAIIDKVNGYLGYRAANELAAAPDYTSSPGQDGKRTAAAQPIDAPAAPDDPLSAALARLGRAVTARRHRQ